MHILMQAEMSTDFCAVLGKDSASYKVVKKKIIYFINFIMSLIRVNYVHDQLKQI
jgi:hypothetical protein